MSETYLIISPVACKRGGSFDAEIQFKVEEHYDAVPVYDQRLLKTGFDTRAGAMSYAQIECDCLSKILQEAANTHLAKFKKAKAPLWEEEHDVSAS